MATTVNSNYGAAMALQSLTKTNSELGMIQTRITTGMKVASAKDDGAVFSIAQGMRGEVAGLGSAVRSVNSVKSIVDTALAAGEAVSDLLNQIREKTVAGSDPTLTTSQRTSYQDDVTALIKQINNVVENADFNGQNLVKSGATGVSALAGQDGSTVLEVATAIMDTDTIFTGQASYTAGTNVLSLAATTATEGAASTPGAVTAVDAAIASVSAKLSALGTTSKRLDIQGTLLGKVSDAIESGIGNLVDADLAKESAKLQSMQVKQQLGVQALQIANQAPQSILSYFK